MAFFHWLLEKNGNTQIIFAVVSRSPLQVHPTMMTSASENPGNIKRVHLEKEDY